MFPSIVDVAGVNQISRQLLARAAGAICGIGGAPAAVANAYTGPAPATADIQAFEVSFWNNVRVQNRCGACHNSTSPAQMPNFARSDNVNLAYVQANSVVNLASPAQSLMVTKVGGARDSEGGWLPAQKPDQLRAGVEDNLRTGSGLD